MNSLPPFGGELPYDLVALATDTLDVIPDLDRATLRFLAEDKGIEIADQTQLFAAIVRGRAIISFCDTAMEDIDDELTEILSDD